MKESQVCKCGRYTFRYGIGEVGNTIKCPECEREYFVYADTDEDGVTETSLELQTDYLTE